MANEWIVFRGVKLDLDAEYLCDLDEPDSLGTCLDYLIGFGPLVMSEAEADRVVAWFNANRPGQPFQSARYDDLLKAFAAGR